jgi:hypothetical protein
MTYELVTINQYGDVEANVYSSLKDAAEKMLRDMEEAVADDLIMDLPEDAALFRANFITTTEDELYYIVEEQHGRWQVRHVIPASKADYYAVGEEVLSSMGGSSLHVRGKAVITRDVTFYQVEIDRDHIKDLEAELKLLLGESP